MNVKAEIGKKKSAEKILRKKLETVLQEADELKKTYFYEDQKLDLIRQKQKALGLEVKKSQARISAIVDLDQSYQIDSLDSEIFIKDELHQEVYDNTVKLADFDLEMKSLNDDFSQNSQLVLDLKNTINDELDSIESDAELLKKELEDNLQYQEKLKRVADPEYNMKTDFDKALQNESSNTFLISSLVVIGISIPFFGPISIAAFVFTAFKLYQKINQARRNSSHKDRL